MGDLKTCGLLHKAYSQKEWAFLFSGRASSETLLVRSDPQASMSFGGEIPEQLTGEGVHFGGMG